MTLGHTLGRTLGRTEFTLGLHWGTLGHTGIKLMTLGHTLGHALGHTLDYCAPVLV